MKCLTISQPFASLIADGEKWIENRRWPTNYRGMLAIHAGKGMQYLDRDELVAYPTGCIVAIARLTACKELAVLDMTRAHEKPHGCSRTISQILQHQYTEGPFCWVLEDVLKLETSIAYRGAQGLFEVPDELLPVRI